MTTEGQIVGLEHELQSAVSRQEQPLLERLLAPGFRLASTGRVGSLDRDGWIETAVGGFRLDEFHFDDAVVTVDGDTAVVSSRFTQRASYEGRDASGDWLLTDTWVRRDGEWLLLVRHADPLPTPAEPA